MTIEFKINGNWKLPTQSGYQPGIFKGFETISAYGGMPKVRRTNQHPIVNVTAKYEFGSYQDIQLWNTFWNTTIEQGSLPFVAMLDVGEGLKEYSVQISDGGVTVTEADIEYLCVQIEMVVTLAIDIPTLQDFYYVTSTLPEDIFYLLVSKLPHPTDPFSIYTWYSYVEEDYVESDYVL